ncbi:MULTISPECIES: hypothetical protein [Pontibacillus]|uniref:Uncharacterized protein n=1 Tax=Pontibacillus chungwhensis TaxID=265426 RepID=A0ABY8UZM1_9BACI|nr:MULTISPECIES: hypothetical protein [Pontibacillus]MCD5324567.1 hypothetical protein [Pontibacillus sp. HN14]WIF99137.1 hypothetical protein QNI29_05635 [Pontibacillus chungwhensis]
MLATPFGPLQLIVDGRDIPYQAVRLPVDRSCPDVEGCFRGRSVLTWVNVMLF